MITDARKAEIRSTTGYDVRPCRGTHYHVTVGGEDLFFFDRGTDQFPTEDAAWEVVEEELKERDLQKGAE